MRVVTTLKPSQSKVVHIENTRRPKSLILAYRLFWLTFIVFFASTGGGKLWDRVWHATRHFDTFWSPPHFFVFIMTTVTALLVAVLALTPRLRAWFGPTIRLPLVHVEIAGALAILGSGLVILCLTIICDNFWHAAFGLDETQWSLPHDMLGWSWLIIIFGFASARMAFRPYFPISWLTNIVVALLVLEFLCPPMLGPFYLNYAPHLLQAFAHLPVILGEPTALHMYRIYLTHGLTRLTSPLFIPEVSLFAGVALAFLRALDQRARIFLLAPLLWSLFTMCRDLYTLLLLHYGNATHLFDLWTVALKEPSLWVPIPLLVAAVSLTLLQRIHLKENICYSISGWLFAYCTFCIWHTSNWMFFLVIPAGFITLVGTKLGKWLYQLLERPTLEQLTKLLLITCAEIPAMLGIIDLFLRKSTP